MMQNPQPRSRMASPLSMQSTDSNILGSYQHLGGGDPYSTAANRSTSGGLPPQNSPPLVQHPSGSTDNSLSSRPSTNRSASATNSHISTASSMSRASDGAGFYSPTVSEFGRGHPPPGSGKPMHEDTLYRHYTVLKSYLAPYLKDEAGNNRPTRARDKLLRLSPTQFHELSTDVYDELLRREEDRKRPGGGVPPSLPPKGSFHPKRNQARQKLSTLPSDRFRQLATDVYYELERRIPRFTDADVERVGSPTESVQSRTSSRHGPPPGMRGPPPNGYRGPPPPGMRSNGSGPYGPGPYSPSSDDGRIPPRVDSRSRSGTLSQPPNDLGRPIPKTSTIVPNKSTMVEDEPTDDEDDGLDGAKLKEYESQISDLQDKVQDLEERLKATETEAQDTRLREATLVTEKEEWTQAKAEFESRLNASQQSLESLNAELEQVHQERSASEDGLRAQTEQTVADLQVEMDELRRENESLRSQQQGTEHLSEHESLQTRLSEQEKITEEVRNNAEQFLQEMRLLSEQSELALEKEEQLHNQIATLEKEMEHWRVRYTKARSQIRSLKASSIGLDIQNEDDKLLRNRQALQSDLIRHDGSGIARDTDVTAYQISIDELLLAARDADSSLALQKAKAVVKAIKAITTDVDGEFSSLNSPLSATSHAAPPSILTNGGGSTTSVHPAALKGRVSRDANRLVTAARTHATSHGLAPVSLLDAAASNLTSSLMKLLKTVGIKPSPDSELHHDSMNSDKLAIETQMPNQAPRLYSDDDDDVVVDVDEITDDFGGGPVHLQLQPQAFDDPGMESPIIKEAGFANAMHDSSSSDAKETGKPGVSGGWFSMLKGRSMIDSDDDHGSDDGYDYA